MCAEEQKMGALVSMHATSNLVCGQTLRFAQSISNLDHDLKILSGNKRLQKAALVLQSSDLHTVTRSLVGLSTECSIA